MTTAPFFPHTGKSLTQPDFSGKLQCLFTMSIHLQGWSCCMRKHVFIMQRLGQNGSSTEFPHFPQFSSLREAKPPHTTGTSSKQSSAWKTEPIVTDLWSPFNNNWQLFPHKWENCHFQMITFQFSNSKKMHILKRETCFKMSAPLYLWGTIIINCHSKESKFT